MAAPLRRLALQALLALVPCGPAVPAPLQDARAALARLDSPTADERRAAERWLAQNLRPADLPAVAERTRSASAETLRRLERALGCDERHLGLVALLLTDGDPGVRELGEDALTRLVAGWLGEEGLEPAPSLRVIGALALRGAGEYYLSLEPQPLAPLLERVVRLAGEGVGRRGPGVSIDVALDPRLADVRFGTAGPVPQGVTGDFVQLLLDVTGVQSLEVEGFGLEGFEGRNAWLHVTSRSQRGRQRADQLIASWLRDVLDPGDAGERTRAARALAGSGWTAALAWLERRWLERGDGAALDGLALAAARGRVVPSLATPDAVGRLLREVDEALGEGTPAGERRADRGRAALAALPPFGAHGDDLAALVAGGLEGATPRGRFVRLSVLAGMGVVPPAQRALLRGRLQGPTRGERADVELETLRALAASRPAHAPPAWGRLARAGELLVLAAARGQEGAVPAWMRAADLAPPEAWRDASALPSSWDAWLRLLVAEAWLAVPGEAQTAAAHLSALPAAAFEDPRVERRLRRIAAGPLCEGLSQALSPEPEELGSRGRLALLAGILPQQAQPQALATLVTDGGAIPGRLVLLGALCAGVVREGARGALLDAVRTELEEPPPEEPSRQAWARACERAWNELVSADLDGEAEAWLDEVAALLRQARYRSPGPGGRIGRERGHPLVGDLARRRWPRLTSAEPTPLVELESPLPAS